MFKPGLLAPALLLLACGCGKEAPDGQAGRSDATVGATLASAVPAGQASPAPSPYSLAGYEDLKIAAAEFAKGYDFLPPLAEMSPPPDALNIFDCGEDYSSQEVVEIDAREARVEALARRVAVLEKTLRREGYAKDVYAPALLRYEKDMLAFLGEGPVPSFDDPSYSAWEQRLQGLFAGLAADLEARRARLQPDKLPIVQQGECGASEAAFRITPAPANGRVWLITQFAFDVCRVRRRDPWNLDTCRWAEVSPERPAYLSGNYVYQARWPGGARGRGKVNLDGSIDEDGEPDTVTVRPD